MFWHHGMPNLGEPPEPLFAAAAEVVRPWLTYDRPGYGGSSSLPDRNIAPAATDVVSFADPLGIDPFAVMGHSGGASHALACGAMLPERLVGVVSVSALAPFGAENLDWFGGMVASGIAAASRCHRGTRSEAAGASAASYFQTSVELTLAQQFWASRMAAISYIVATPILNFLLYQTQLVPRFISVWGFIAVVMLATGLALGIPDPTRGFQPGQLLLIPIILWELFFATWLQARGFNTTAIAALSSASAASATAR